MNDIETIAASVFYSARDGRLKRLQVSGVDTWLALIQGVGDNFWCCMTLCCVWWPVGTYYWYCVQRLAAVTVRTLMELFWYTLSPGSLYLPSDSIGYQRI